VAYLLIQVIVPIVALTSGLFAVFKAQASVNWQVRTWNISSHGLRWYAPAVRIGGAIMVLNGVFWISLVLCGTP